MFMCLYPCGEPHILDSLKKEFHSKVGDYYVADKVDAVLK